MEDIAINSRTRSSFVDDDLEGTSSIKTDSSGFVTGKTNSYQNGLEYY